MALEPGQTLSHYRLVEKLGEGGMGVVWKAEDTRLRRQVALKILPPEVAARPDRRQRFKREARAIAALDHPNIVTIYSIEETDGTHFLTMQLLDGTPLSSTIPLGGFPLERFFAIAIPLADAVHAAHEQGVTHRDLKPANVMITRNDQVKVLDFGLAKWIESRPTEMTQLTTEYATREGRILGTVPYMSPEQAEGRPVDQRSDIFSLGIVLYEMATGERPFRGDTPAALMSSILRDAPPPTTKLVPSHPRRLAWIIGHCLEKDVGRRFQNAIELRNELEQLSSEKGAVVGGEAPTSGTAAANLKAIAVLPLDNLTRDPEQDYFADGMTEALITELAKLGALKVISRTSVMQYKGVHKPLREIANELGVGAVVEGSVLRAGERVRITAQLIEAETDRHLWAESYERDLADVLSLQGEVARAVAKEVRVSLTPAEEARLTTYQPLDPVVHEAYVKGRFHWHQRTETGFYKAIEQFQQAIDLDPLYARAYAGLADAYGMLGNFGLLPPRESFPKAKAAAERALEIDDAIADAHASLGFVATNYDWDWPHAEHEYRRAIDLEPSYAIAHHFYACFLSLMNRHEEAIASITKARELDPLSRPSNAFVGLMFFHAGQCDQAIEELGKALEIGPDFALTRNILGMVYEQKGLYQQAITELQAATRASGGIPEQSAALAHAYAKAGDLENAQRLLDQLIDLSERRYVSSFEIALVYFGLGDEDRGFERLERAFRERAYEMAWLIVDPRLRRLRRDPRFEHLLERVGLPR